MDSGETRPGADLTCLERAGLVERRRREERTRAVAMFGCDQVCGPEGSVIPLVTVVSNTVLC